MYTEITKDRLLEEAYMVKNFIITKGLDSRQLIEIATSLKDKKEGIVDIYYLDGADTINYPSFASIRMNPRFVIKGGGIRSKTDGLILPQSEPIILIIANFNKLEKEDQDKYVGAICKKEESDYYPHIYLHDESIVILGLGATDEEPRISYKLEVRRMI
jgi:hypothetical protein